MMRLHGAFGAGCAVLLLSSASPLFAQLSWPYGYGRGGGSLDYGPNRQIAINECASAAQVRLDAYGGGRVLAITDSALNGDGGLVVRGMASRQYSGSNRVQLPADVSWRCRTDPRGFIVEVMIGPADYGYAKDSTRPEDDYSRFGYRRY